MPDYTLTELCKLADVTPRTVRYYISQGLLPGPSQSGPAARYTEAHLGRLRLIKKLQAGYLPLAEIRSRLRGQPDDPTGLLADRVEASRPADSAIDYIHQALGQRHASVAAPSSVTARAKATPPPAALSAATPQAESPERSQWERIVLGPDVELHVRRPLTRQQTKRVDRLISIAGQLLEED